MPQQGKRWCFTLNNYVAADETRLRDLAGRCEYLVYGREVGESGTPHLQGFIVFNTNHRFTAAKAALGDRYHLELARGTSGQASLYCKKENDFEEFGQLPTGGGKTNRFDDFKTWVLEQPSKPTAAVVAFEFPSIYLQYGRVMEWIDKIYPRVPPTMGDFRGYQASLATILEGDPDDRSVYFVIDERGGTGKSWFVKKWLSMHHEFTQCLSIGKRDDLAYVVDESKRVFLFDLPRSQSEFLQYSVLEQLKDGMVFSTKYNSRMKMFDHKVHVVVFMNEHPDMTKLSADRYKLINWVSI